MNDRNPVLKRPRRIVSAPIAMVAALAWGPAAAQLAIGPVVVEFGPQQRVAAVGVQLDESAAQPVRLQAEVLRWRQDLAGQAVATETDEMLVTPPVADLRPGQRQVFRLALRGARPAPEELAYRLVLEDISAAPAGQADAAERHEETPVRAQASSSPSASLTQGDRSGGAPELAVDFRLRYDLPVMVAPLGGVTQSLRWKVCPASAAEVCVRVLNAGNRRVKLTALTLAGDGAGNSLSLGEGEVLLVGTEREWRLPAAGPLPPPAPSGLRVQTSRGELIEATPGGF